MSEDRPKARLFVADDLNAAATVRLGEAAAHYLAGVLRLGSGDRISLFNGRDGEWLGRIDAATRRVVVVAVETERRPQQAEPGPWLAFSPLKKDALDVLVEKATELGVERLIAVQTQRTVVLRVNAGRLRAQAIEAAEQCERLTVPVVAGPVTLAALTADWPPSRRLWVLDEHGGGAPLADQVAASVEAGEPPPGFLVGPEGGFPLSELDALDALPFVSRIHLGPRILRAETAALAALAGWLALSGDGRRPPPSR